MSYDRANCKKKPECQTNRRPNDFAIRELTLGKLLVIVPLLILAILGGQFLSAHRAANTVKVNFPPVGIGGGASTTGYYLVSSDGGVFTQGTDTFHGSLGASNVRNIVGMATTAGDAGYWLVGADGGVFAYGNATYHGGTPSGHTGNFVGIAGASNGGYWLIDSSGQIYAYSTPAIPITNPSGNNSPFVGIAATADGKGFWAVDQKGQVYAFGDASYKGAPTGVSNIVGITAGAGGGYWLTGSDGGVYSYGTPFYNSMGGQHLNGPVVGIVHTSDYKG